MTTATFGLFDGTGACVNRMVCAVDAQGNPVGYEAPTGFTLRAEDPAAPFVIYVPPPPPAS